ncbi:MAG: rod shape-determining protein RodA [Phycisphaerales bacterium]|nr:rod shape-determining protein RodA [Phycisphaerales bacterium]
MPQSAVLAVTAALALSAVGLLCIYATESDLAVPRYTVKQLATLLGGALCGLVIVRLGFGWFARCAWVVVALAVVALLPLALARYVSFGELIPNRRGAYRWIQLPGFQFQPSEFAKIAYIVGLAAYLRYRRNYRTLTGLLIPFIASAAPAILILLEPNLGTTILMAPVLFIMLFAAGARTRHLTAILLISLCLAPIAWFGIRGYQRDRILGVLLQSESLRQRIIDEPDKYRFLATPRQARQWTVDDGMQLLRSKTALGSGGLTGEGWGRGTFIEYDFLPDRHNDFVFALIGHQWGLLGCLLVLAFYAIIVMAGMEIAAATTEPFARLLAVGVVALIASQVIINIGMTVGLMPITGMTLPFVSYGGSSLLTNCVAVALLVSVARHRPYLLANHPFEFDRPRDRSASVRPSPRYPAEP